MQRGENTLYSGEFTKQLNYNRDQTAVLCSFLPLFSAISPLWRFPILAQPSLHAPERVASEYNGGAQVCQKPPRWMPEAAPLAQMERTERECRPFHLCSGHAFRHRAPRPSDIWPWAELMAPPACPRPGSSRAARPSTKSVQKTSNPLVCQTLQLYHNGPQRSTARRAVLEGEGRAKG